MIRSAPKRVLFGPFELEPGERLLLRDGLPVALPPKALDVLAVLAARQGELVTKDELLAGAWPGVVVEENVLSVAISRLRAALGEDYRSSIQAVPGYGYRLVAPDTPSGDGLQRSGLAAAARAPSVDDLVASLASHGDGFSPARPPAPRAAARRPARRWLLGAAVVATAVTFIVVATRVSHDEPGSPRAGVADVPAGALVAYREGRALWESRRGDAMLPALTQFKRAATIDSTFAAAYLGQALVYAFGYRTDAEVEAAASRALALDSTLAEAWAARGFSRAFQRWDWRGASDALARAAELNPLDVSTLQWTAALRMVQRRLPEADAALRQAIRLAPTYAPLHADLCEVAYYRRDFAGARAACQRALTLDPENPMAANHLTSIELAGPDGEAHARRLLQVEAGDFGAYSRSRLHARLGDGDEALALVGEAVADRAVIAPFMRPDPLFDPYRSDPRWIAAMRRMGLGP